MKKLIILILLNLLVMPKLFAQSKILRVEAYKDKSVLYVDIDSFIPATKAPINAVKNGIQLKMKYVFSLQIDKWYVTKPYAIIEKDYLIYFDKISNQFVLLNPVTFRKDSFFSFDNLLHQMERLEHFPILDARLIKPNTKASAQLVLDTKSVPSSLMIDLYFDDDWDLNSKKFNWIIPEKANNKIAAKTK